MARNDITNKDITALNSYTNNNVDRAGTENLTRFFGYNQNIYLDPDLTGFSFVFITKPSLFLYPLKSSDNEKYLAYLNMCTDPKFSIYLETENTNSNDIEIIKQLSYFQFPTSSTLFLPIFTNLAKSFTPGDITLDSTDVYSTKEGYRYQMPTHATISRAAGEISIPVSETGNLDFTKMLTIWVNYINNISNGTFTANPKMIKQNMLDYTCSIYYFSLAPDGQTIKYWARYTGCYPTTIPYSAQTYQKGVIEQSQFDVNFKYTFKEDMDPRILEDFNAISLQLVTPELSNYNYDDLLGTLTTENSEDYTSYTKANSLLSKTKLSSSTLRLHVQDEGRDPLVFFEDERESTTYSGKIKGSYKLSFGGDALINSYVKTILPDIDTSEFEYSELKDNNL